MILTMTLPQMLVMDRASGRTIKSYSIRRAKVASTNVRSTSCSNVTDELKRRRNNIILSILCIEKVSTFSGNFNRENA